MKKLSVIILILLVLIPSVSALQQTAGAINISIEPGNSVTEKYGIRNDNNVSTSIVFNITGNGSEYILYEKNIILNPNEFRYVNITATVPKDYVGNNTIKLIIYALEEGKKGGQVQLNIRLGKHINLNIAEPVATNQPDNQNNNLVLVGITIIGIVIIVAVVMRRKTKERKINGKEVEKK